MQLTVDNVLQHLFRRGLIPHGSVDEAAIRVIEMSRRNRNFKVLRGSLPGYFVKQARTGDPEGWSTLAWEAQFLGTVAPARRGDAWFALMPTFFDYDRHSEVLVLELFEEGESLHEIQQRLGREADVARLLGSALGSHHANLRGPCDPGERSAFPRRLPRVLSPERLGLHALKQANTAAGMQLLQWFRRTPELIGHLDDLGRSWQFECLMHGDLKGDNCLFVQDQGDRLALRLVDWEHADLGDSCWDLGGLVQDYLATALTASSADPTTIADRIVRRWPEEVAGLQPVLGELWQTYVAARGIAPVSAKGIRERVLLCAAARMVQSAFEWALYSPASGDLVVALLQISLGMFQDPICAAERLLGG